MMFVMRVVALGILAAAGSFSAAVMSPALSQAAAYYGIDPTLLAGLAATLFQVAFGIAHLWWGWRSDVSGRISVLWTGLAIFAAGTMLCFLPSLLTLLIARVLMGIGAAATLVVTRAMIRDLYDGESFGRAMTNLTMLFALVPGFAPVIGMIVESHLGWPEIIWTIMMYVACMAALLRFIIDRSNIISKLPIPAHTSFFGSYMPIVTSSAFRYSSGVAALGLAPMFVLYSVGATAYGTEFNLEPQIVVIHITLVTVIAYLAGGEIQKALSSRLSTAHQLRAGVGLSFAGCACALAASEVGFLGAWVVSASYCLYSMGLAFTLPIGTRSAIALFPQAAGAASAVAGLALMTAPSIGMAAYGVIKSIGGISPLPSAMFLSASALALWYHTGLKGNIDADNSSHTSN